MNRKQKILTIYSKIYSFVFIFLMLENIACLYTLSTGNAIPHPNGALMIWSLTIAIGTTSYACKMKLADSENNGE